MSSYTPHTWVSAEVISAAKMNNLETQYTDAMSWINQPNGTAGLDSSGLINLAQIPAFTQSLAGSGYVKLPGGLILNWGSLSVPSGYTGSAAFAVAFPTGCLFSLLSQNYNSTTSGYAIEWSTTASAISISAPNAGLGTYYFIAIGH